MDCKLVQTQRNECASRFFPRWYIIDKFSKQSQKSTAAKFQLALGFSPDWPQKHVRSGF